MRFNIYIIHSCCFPNILDWLNQFSTDMRKYKSVFGCTGKHKNSGHSQEHILDDIYLHHSINVVLCRVTWRIHRNTIGIHILTLLYQRSWRWLPWHCGYRCAQAARTPSLAPERETNEAANQRRVLVWSIKSLAYFFRISACKSVAPL